MFASVPTAGKHSTLTLGNNLSFLTL